jgi:cytochrome c biogenesis protein CcmG/thiol:disulfide interchange protein DsbE
VSAEDERPATVSEDETSLRPDWGRWTRGLGLALVALAVAALVSLLAFGLLNEGESGMGAASLNREAPDFTLNLFGGGTFTLSENRGQPVVMNIWASWCDSCRQEAADMEQDWRSFRDQGVIFVGVNVMDSRGDAEAFLEQFDITYPNGPDESDIYFQYGAMGTPETFFIDRDGVIVQKFMGPLKAEQLSASVEELLQ